MNTACKTCPSMPDLLADNRRFIKGGLDIGFGNGWAAAYHIIRAAAEEQKDPAVKQAAWMLVATLEQVEIEKRINHAKHLDDYIA